MSFELLAHRGFWLTPEEKNSEAAFRRALEKGYGIETDIRDLDGALVISHDPPRRDATTLATFLDLYDEYGKNSTLALNIKSDGLAKALDAVLKERGVERYFVFDMSVPDMLGYLRAGMTAFSRHSEFETGSPLDDQVAGLWLDGLTIPSVHPETLAAFLDKGKTVTLVSPELHGRPHRAPWAEWKAVMDARPQGSVMLCTDFPDEARDFFA